MRDINFVLEDALSFDGNTGPYAQYTYARTCSILEKAKCNGSVAECEFSSEEKELAKVLARFPDCVSDAIAEYEPSLITRYILDLCAAFNRFYHNCQILSQDNEIQKNNRIALTKCTNAVLGRALELICMKKTEKI
jgi:arginyl-tRNA synthetase